MVPYGEEGACVCAPGGTRNTKALEAGCPKPKINGERPKGETPGAALRQAITTRMRSQRKVWKRCYDRSLKGSGVKKQGRFVVAFGIGPLGEVYEPRIKEGAFPDAGVQECVLKSLRGLRFPAPPDGWVSVSYPLNLRLDSREEKR